MTLPTRFLPLMALALLAACSRSPTPAPDLMPDTPMQTACRAEARRDPAVVNLGRQRNLGNWANENRVGYEMRVAETQAYRECMRRNGAAMPGGVESPRPRF
jgi:hypothetical protein